MNCEVCQKETATGGPYIVRYGFERRELISHKREAVYRSIAGTRSVTICDSCLNRYISRQALFSGLGFLLLISSLGLVNFLSAKPLAEQISPIVLGIIGGAFLFMVISNRGRKSKGRLQMGDVYAMQLVKPELRQQGYRSFFTRQD